MYLLFILGRTPQLALKEIELAATILPFQWSLSMVQAEVVLLKPSEGFDLDKWLLEPKNKELLTKLQNRLGGTLKIVHVSQEISKESLASVLAEKLEFMATKEFGLSLYGKNVDVMKLGLKLKQEARKAGHSLRYIAPKDGTKLSTAQVFHHKLAEKGGEFVLVSKNDGYLLGQTEAVQDIESYTRRDRDLPGVDPVSGVLPPKLAQMMINIALTNPEKATVYDPFCGNGRIMEEARLMGVKALGSDLEEVKVTSSQKNLEWLCNEYGLADFDPSTIWQQDATQPDAVEKLVGHIKEGELVFVGEPYLGKPLRKPLTPEEAEIWASELETLYLKFFQVWSKNPGNDYNLYPDRMILVFPSVRLINGKQLSLFDRIVDRLQQIGYSSVQVSDYGRPDALVSRQIVQISNI